MSRIVDYYFSVVSPWTFLGHAPFMEIARRHGVSVIYHPMELGPVFAQTGGLPLAKRAPERQRYRLMEMQRWRVKRAVDFHIHPQFWPVDGKPGDKLILAAIARGMDPGALAGRLFSAVWQRQENIADPATLQAIADEVGLPGAELLAESQSVSIAATYDANYQKALDAGVFGAPSYVLDGEVFWGQDRLDLLNDALASGRAAFTPGT